MNNFIKTSYNYLFLVEQLKPWLKSNNLSINEYVIISCLKEHEIANVTEISIYTNIQKNTVSRTLKKLVSKNLISAQHCDYDYRIVFFELTTTARNLYDSLLLGYLDRMKLKMKRC